MFSVFNHSGYLVWVGGGEETICGLKAPSVNIAIWDSLCREIVPQLKGGK